MYVWVVLILVGDKFYLNNFVDELILLKLFGVLKGKKNEIDWFFW